jgi:hypothetical protein
MTIYGTHIDRIWTNEPTKQCMSKLFKHIGRITTQCILHSNCQIMFHNIIT